MRTLYVVGGNLTNLRFCHCSHVLLSPTPPFLVPSFHAPNFTLSITKASPSSSISCKNCHYYYSPCSVIRASMASSTTTKPFSVLFVCLSNICRSPAMKGVFTNLVKKRGFEFQVQNRFLWHHRLPRGGYTLILTKR